MTSAQTFNPTPEQIEALRLFSTGKNLAIQAGAGAGKTRTLQLLAESAPERTGIFTAFNRSIIQDASRKMPQNVSCSTMHSLAMRSIPRAYKSKLDRAKRQRPAEVAKVLGISGMAVMVGQDRKFLSAGYLASLALKSIDRFCQSGDPAPLEKHVPYVEGIDFPNLATGARGWSNNGEIRRALLPAMIRAWEDLLKVDGGRLTGFGLGHCLKLYERTSPVLLADFVMVDEAQDLNGVMISILEQQKGDTQLVFVGDSAQSINEWMGSIDALKKVPAENTTYLTTSFRFGPAIADVANGLLSRLGADLRIRGGASHMSTVAVTAEPECILTRTNAEAVKRVMKVIGEGGRPYLMGGGADVVRFAEAAKAIKAGEWTGHQDLGMFSTWGEVQEYVANDPQGSDLKLMVELIDDYGVDTILETLNNPVSEADADVIISTAHKSKGREWDSVALAGDFFEPREGEDDLGDAELKLLYVAVTRARRELDLTLCPQALSGGKGRAPEVTPAPEVEEDLSGLDAKALTLRYLS